MNEIPWGDIVSGATLLTVVYGVARGIITRKDCDKCKAGIKADTHERRRKDDKAFERGSLKFEGIQETLGAHGEQLAAIGATQEAQGETLCDVKDSVQMLVTAQINKAQGGGVV